MERERRDRRTDIERVLARAAVAPDRDVALVTAGREGFATRRDGRDEQIPRQPESPIAEPDVAVPTEAEQAVAAQRNRLAWTPMGTAYMGAEVRRAAVLQRQAPHATDLVAGEQCRAVGREREAVDRVADAVEVDDHVALRQRDHAHESAGGLECESAPIGRDREPVRTPRVAAQ